MCFEKYYNAVDGTFYDATKGEQMSIKIVLAEDHTITRQGIHSMLNQRSDMEVVGEAETGRQAVQVAEKLNPDIVIIDVMLPELNGIEATRKITST